MRSVTVVLPASMCAQMPMLRMWVRSVPMAFFPDEAPAAIVVIVGPSATKVGPAPRVNISASLPRRDGAERGGAAARPPDLAVRMREWRRASGFGGVRGGEPEPDASQKRGRTPRGRNGSPERSLVKVRLRPPGGLGAAPRRANGPRGRGGRGPRAPAPGGPRQRRRDREDRAGRAQVWRRGRGWSGQPWPRPRVRRPWRGDRRAHPPPPHPEASRGACGGSRRARRAGPGDGSRTPERRDRRGRRGWRWHGRSEERRVGKEG